MADKREIVVIQKTDSNPESWVDKIEKISKLLAIVAIPVIVALAGNWIQASIEKGKVSKDYVSLAVEILRDTNSTDPLKDWAVKVMESNSPVPFTVELKEKIASPQFSSSLKRAFDVEQDSRNTEFERVKRGVQANTQIQIVISTIYEMLRHETDPTKAQQLTEMQKKLFAAIEYRRSDIEEEINRLTTSQPDEQ